MCSIRFVPGHRQYSTGRPHAPATASFARFGLMTLRFSASLLRS